MAKGIGDSAIARLVERQMRNWEISRQQHLAEEPPQEDTVQDFICISRMVGISERGIAEALGERLEWPVFGKEILEANKKARKVSGAVDQFYKSTRRVAPSSSAEAVEHLRKVMNDSVLRPESTSESRLATSDILPDSAPSGSL